MPGNLVDSPSEVVQNLLIEQDLGFDPNSPGLSKQDWRVFSDLLLTDPDNVISVFDMSGRGEGYTQFDGEMQEHHGIKVFVRSDVRKAAYRKARAIAQIFDRSSRRVNATVGQNIYLIHAITRMGDILDITSAANVKGSETKEKYIKDEGRHIFVINALVSVEPAVELESETLLREEDYDEYKTFDAGAGDLENLDAA